MLRPPPIAYTIIRDIAMCWYAWLCTAPRVPCSGRFARQSGVGGWPGGRAASGCGIRRRWSRRGRRTKVGGKRLPSESAAAAAAAAFQYVTDARASRHDRDARDSATAVAAAAAAAEAEAAGTYRRDGQCEWRFILLLWLF